MDKHAMMNWHLRHNHVPAIVNGEAFAFAAIDAIEAGDYDRIIDMDDRVGRARDVVESWHLEDFLSDEVVGRTS